MNKINYSLSFHFLLENNSDKTQEAAMFESNKNLIDKNFGNDPSVNITLLNSYGQYSHLLSDLGPNPCLISGMYLKSKHNSKKVTIIHSENFLRTETPYQVSTGLQRLKDFLISGECGLKVELLPHEELEMFLRVLRRVNRTNPLDGKDLVDEYLLQEKF